MSDFSHSLLLRQLRKHLPSGEIPPELRPLLEAVDRAYHEADADRTMLERSLELTSHELLQRNAELRQLMEANPDLCLRLDRQGRILDWYGQSGSEVFWGELVLQRNVCERLPPDAAEHLAAALERALAYQQPESLELRLTLGERACVLELAFMPIFGARQGLVIIRDATERYHFEEQLARRNRELLSFHMMAEVSMTSASLDEVYHRIANELQTLTGFETVAIEAYDSERDLMVIQASTRHGEALPLEVPLDQTLSGLVVRSGEALVEFDALERPEYAHPALRAHQVKTFVCIPLRDDQAGAAKVIGTLSLGSPRALEVNQDFVRWMSSMAQYLVLLIQRKQTEILMRQSKQAAEEANLAKTRFLAIMSHELRTPLNSVLGFTSVLRKSQALTGSREQGYLERIQRNGLHLLRLINEVLDISRIEAGQHQLDQSSFDLGELLCQTMLELESTLSRKSLHWCLDCAAELAPLSSDAAKLQQILTNLIANAIKFTPEGGNIEIRVRQETDWLGIEVRDSGCGIAAELHDKIFEPFFQADSSYARLYEGTGLGLAISRALSRMLGGELNVDSLSGQGASFILKLPIAIEP